MPFPTTPILDTFQRANENPLSDGGKWTSPVFSSDVALEIVSNNCQDTTNATPGSDYWNVQKFGPDCEAYVEVTSAFVSAVDVFARVQTPNAANPGGYEAEFNNLGGGSFQVGLSDLLSQTGIGNTLTNFTVGDSYGISCIGSTISIWTNDGGTWTKVLQVTNSVTLAAGYIGCGGFDQSSTPVFTFQNFGGGTAVENVQVSGGPQVVIGRMLARPRSEFIG